MESNHRYIRSSRHHEIQSTNYRTRSSRNTWDKSKTRQGFASQGTWRPLPMAAATEPPKSARRGSGAPKRRGARRWTEELPPPPRRAPPKTPSPFLSVYGVLWLLSGRWAIAGVFSNPEPDNEDRPDKAKTATAGPDTKDRTSTEGWAWFQSTDG